MKANETPREDLLLRDVKILFDENRRLKEEIETLQQVIEDQAPDEDKAIAILRSIHGVPPNSNGEKWIIEDEWFIKEWVEGKGILYGDCAAIGKVLGRTADQVRSKIQNLRKKGFINV